MEGWWDGGLAGWRAGGMDRWQDGGIGVQCWAEPCQRHCRAHRILNSFSGCSGGINMASSPTGIQSMPPYL